MKKGNLTTLRKSAFTLAEVLITITIIGIVAAVVLPTIMEFSQEKIWTSSSENFKAKLNVALKTMNVKGELARLDSTEEFVENLGKNFRLINVCKGNELDKCFDKKISYLKGGNPTKPVALTDLIELDGNDVKAKNLGHADWESNVLGIQFANGVSGLIAYNDQNCNPKKSAQEELFNCIALAYDVNANASPNTIKQDILNINAPIIGVSADAAPPCDYYSENLKICFTFVGTTSAGYNCVDNPNNYFNTGNKGVNGCKNLGANTLGCTNNRQAEAAMNCESLGMVYAEKEAIDVIIEEAGWEYLSEIAARFGADFVVGQYNNIWKEVWTSTGYTISNQTWTTVNANSPMIGVCMKRD